MAITDRASHGEQKLNCPVCGSGEDGCCVCQQMLRAEKAEAEVAEMKARIEALTQADNLMTELYLSVDADLKRAEEALRESAPVQRGWVGYPDGSRSDVERWVKAADGDWISLDSTRRTSRDIMPVND